MKYSLKSKLFNYIGIEQQNKYLDKIDEKKKTFTLLLSKYLKGTEAFNESEENNLLKESENLTHDVEKSIQIGQEIDETWVLLNIKNSNQANEDSNK